MKRKEPTPLQDLVRPIFAERKQEAHLTLTAVRSRWGEIVGDELARKTWPLRVHRGVLWVGAPDASWAYQFQFLRSELLQCLVTVMGPSDIAELRFKAAELPAPDEAAVLPTHAAVASGSGARDEAPADPDIERAAAQIADPALRTLFVRSLSKQRRRRESGTGANPGGGP